jgi:hypothetical protein
MNLSSSVLLKLGWAAAKGINKPRETQTTNMFNSTAELNRKVPGGLIQQLN